jgi:shikimate kinase / 3-dehydroquinate synthase
MQRKKYRFSGKTTSYYFNADFDDLKTLVSKDLAIIVTDDNIFRHHEKMFAGWKTIVLPSGEQNKVQSTVDEIIAQLIRLKAERRTTLIGIGGGVITDITGYAASVYMRGLPFGFLPVSVLAMVDAAIGGKNGVDVGPYKNLVGTIRQPDFLLFVPALLRSLPAMEWINGFAEIIKHGCIKDVKLFETLEKNSLSFFQESSEAMGKLVKKNAVIKSDVVVADEFEQGERRLLNFGHTWGHAVETKLNIPHGFAVSIGMVMACQLSESMTGFRDTDRVIALLRKYGLPVGAVADHDEVFDVLTMDKKRERSSMNYILLEKIGKGVAKSIPLGELKKLTAAGWKKMISRHDS